MTVDEFVVSAIRRATYVAPSQVSSKSTLEELCIDSLALVSIVAQFEAVYGVELSTDVALDLAQAEDVAELCERMRRCLGPSNEERSRTVDWDDGYAHSIFHVRPECTQLFMIFRGRAMRLMMASSEFLKATRIHDRNIMLFGDCRQTDYLKGVSSEISSFAAFVDWQREQRRQRFPHVLATYCLGTSVGALAAIMSGYLLRVQIVWAFALPDTGLKHPQGHYLEGTEYESSLQLSDLLKCGNGVTEYRIYYNRSEEQDRRAAESLVGCPGVKLFPQSGLEHPVVHTLARQGRLDDVLIPYEGR